MAKKRTIRIFGASAEDGPFTDYGNELTYNIQKLIRNYMRNIDMDLVLVPHVVALFEHTGRLTLVGKIGIIRLQEWRAE